MNKNILSVFILVLLISLFISGCGDDQGTATYVSPTGTGVTPTPGTNLSAINGIVYNSNGTPASGATVTLTPNISSSESYGEVQTATAGTDGSFSFTVCYGGTYFVEAKKGTTLLGSQEFTLPLGSTITLIIGQASTGTLRVQLTPSDAVAAVTLDGMTSSSDKISASQSATGEYIFYIPGGTYSFTVNATGYDKVTRTGVVVNVGEETLETVDLTAEEIDIGTLTKLEPRVIVNANLTTQEVKVTGSNFTGNGTDNNITITLISVSGGTSIPVSGITVDDPNTVRFTADFTGAASGEYALTLTHSPITASSSTETSNIWLMDTIQGAIDKASTIYASEKASGKMTASAEDPGWVQAYIPAGTYELLAGSPLPTAINTNSLLGLSSGVYLKGAGGDTGGTHIAASGGMRHFYGTYNSDIAIDGLRLTGGSVTDNGGALFADNMQGNWLITDSVISGNNALIDGALRKDGGAIYLKGSDGDAYQSINVTITNNTFTNNTASSEGGAMYIYPPTKTTSNITVTNNTVSQNTSYGRGGGIRLNSYGMGGEYIINNNTITDNYIENRGGAGLYIYFEYGGKVTIENNRITGNYNTNPDEAGDNGGGIVYNGYSNSIDITGNTISNNGNYNGGGMYIQADNGSALNVSGNNITGNCAISSGGGIYANSGDVDSSTNIKDNEISGNGAAKMLGATSYTATVNGGGVYAEYGVKLYVNSNNIYNNTGTSGNGGAQLYYDAAPPVLDGTSNWWGGASPENNSVVYNYTGGYVTVSPYAGSQFTVPVTP